jgi:hypothetical protein
MKTCYLLLLSVTILGSLPAIVQEDLQQLCPVGASLAALRGAPRECKLAALHATHGRMDRIMQQIERHLERLERQYPALMPRDQSN